MSLPVCPIQELCLHYDINSKRKTHHQRMTNPCKLFLDMTCDESIRIQIFLGETMTCDIGKIESIKEKLNDIRSS